MFCLVFLLLYIHLPVLIITTMPVDSLLVSWWLLLFLDYAYHQAQGCNFARKRTHFEMSDHFFFLAKYPGCAVHAVEMFPVAQVFAVRRPALQC